jgi:YHS domain-containing protein
MQIYPQNTNFKSLHMGKTYHFCSAVCSKGVFDRDPEKHGDTSTQHQPKG